MKIRHIAIAAATAALLTSPGLFAQGQPQGQQGQQGQQQQQQQRPMPQEQQEAPDVSDSQKEQFVDAYLALQEVRQDYSEQVQNAEGQEEAQSIQQEARDAMMTAITDTGMSMEEYQEVAMAMQQDDEVRQELADMIQERQGNGDGGEGESS